MLWICRRSPMKVFSRARVLPGSNLRPQQEKQFARSDRAAPVSQKPRTGTSQNFDGFLEMLAEWLMANRPRWVVRGHCRVLQTGKTRIGWSPSQKIITNWKNREWGPRCEDVGMKRAAQGSDSSKLSVPVTWTAPQDNLPLTLKQTQVPPLFSWPSENVPGEGWWFFRKRKG